MALSFEERLGTDGTTFVFDRIASWAPSCRSALRSVGIRPKMVSADYGLIQRLSVAMTNVDVRLIYWPSASKLPPFFCKARALFRFIGK